MRKQGVWVTRFVFLLLFGFVVAFMGYHIISAVDDPTNTFVAVLTDSDDIVRAHGFFVRDEQVVARPSGVVEVLAQTGDRVSRDETLAVIYDDVEALSVAEQASALSERIEQLEEVRRLSADIADTATLSGLIDRSLISLISGCDQRDVTAMHRSALELKSLLYKWESTYDEGVDLDTLIVALTAERDQVSTRLTGRYTPVVEGVPGTFSPVVDGYEALLTPAKLDDFTVETWDAFLQADPPEPSEEVIGKLARGFTWYYAVTLPTDEIGFMTKGKSLSVRLTGSDERFSMQVKRIQEAEGGRSFVVLESRANLAETISCREESLDICLSRYSGIRVPREAIRINEDGVTGVYCAVLTQARFKPVEIILERDGYYLVAYDPTEKNALLPGDELLIGGKDLYDGKNIR